MTFHAYAADEPGAPLRSFSYQPRPLGRHDVEIDISHCGLCHSDLHLLRGQWKTARFPLVAGHEIVGTLSDLGAAVRGLVVGQRVGVGWQRGACTHCEWCVRGEENLCPDRQATCVGHHGGFADRIRVDGHFAHPIPPGLSPEHAAPLLCAGATVFAPLQRFGAAGRVGVIGIGGLGHLALQFARAFGCEVTALSSSPDKEGEARFFGAHRFVDSRDPAQLAAARGSLDLVLSTVPVDLPWRSILDTLRPNGTLCFVGASSGDLRLPPGALISGQRRVTGSAVASRPVMREMLQFAARHGIVPQVEVVPMAELNQALARLEAGEARYRIVLQAEGHAAMVLDPLDTDELPL